MNFIPLRGSLAEKRYFRHQLVKVVDYKSRNINLLWEALKDVVGSNSNSSEVIELVHKFKKKKKASRPVLIFFFLFRYNSCCLNERKRK